MRASVPGVKPRGAVGPQKHCGGTLPGPRIPVPARGAKQNQPSDPTPAQRVTARSPALCLSKDPESVNRTHPPVSLYFTT